MRTASRSGPTRPSTPSRPNRPPNPRTLTAALLALTLLSAPTRAQTRITIPTPDLQLQAQYTTPPTPTAPAVIILHGCGGPYPARDHQWRDLLAAQGHQVLIPDSFGSRGLGSQCTTPTRTVTPNGKRRDDTVAAATYLASLPTTPPGGVIVMGWSNGGSTTLAAAAPGVMPPGLVRAFVAFYPGCAQYARNPGWAPSAPLLIVMGEADDWTPAEPCRQLAAQHPTRITLILYPDAYHDFDAPNRPMRTRTGLAYTANNDGTAHAGTNEPARQAALQQVPAWLKTGPRRAAAPMRRRSGRQGRGRTRTGAGG